MRISSPEVGALWTRYQVGGTLSAEEDRRLFELASNDPHLLAEMLRDDLDHSLLETIGRISRDKRPFEDRVLAHLAAERAAGRLPIPLRRLPSQRSRRFAVAFSMVSLAAAASVLVAVSRRQPVQPPAQTALIEAGRQVEILETRGGVSIVPAAAARRKATPGAFLVQAHDRIETGPSGAAKFAFGGATVELDSGTQVALAPQADGLSSLFVTRGHVEIDISAAQARAATGQTVPTGQTVAADQMGVPGTLPPALIVATPQGRALVGHSHFSLTVSPAATRITVAQGSLTMQRQDKSPDVKVPAGETVSVETRRSALVAAAPLGDAAKTVAAASANQTVVLWQDLEDGAAPEGLLEGQLVPTPPGPEGKIVPGRFCVLGTLNPNWPDEAVVTLQVDERRIKFATGMVLSFDYWVGAGENHVSAQIWDDSQRQNYKLVSPVTVAGAWNHLDVKLSDLEPVRHKSRTMEPGDRIGNVLILSGRSALHPFYVDNIRLTQPASAPSP